jgi:NADH dehydrogenase [ubiquinone] 1 alpha subcomplex assembly factor 2
MALPVPRRYAHPPKVLIFPKLQRRILTLSLGRDLQGNTFWQFRDTRGLAPGQRWRRIVKYPRSTHYSDVKVSPLWHQWLRQTREHPPSVQEQVQDLARQQQIKMLAAQADARWEAKPRVMEAPRREDEQLPLPTSNTTRVEGGTPETNKPARGRPEEAAETNKEGAAEDPWKRARGPSENWHPETWTPSVRRDT